MRIANSNIFAAYVLTFGAAALICFASITRARQISDPDTRRGLVALLLTSGGWATAHVAFLTVPTPELKLLFYEIGLIVGISAVGPWLYFCSAFTGRSLHQTPVFRRLALGVFLTIVLIKVTNPLHHLYFSTAFVTTPFPHLAVQHHLMHWVAMGLAYALATVGYFMLIEMFWQIGHDLKPLVVLVAVTGLPIVLDIIGFVSPVLLDITYEPLGVAPFAAGVLFLYLDDLQTIQLTRDRDDPVIILTDDNRIRDFNTVARDLFPNLETGETIDAVVPEIAAYLDTDEDVIEVDRAGGLRYYQFSSNPFSADQNRLGQVISLTDITDREQYRTELERQNERLDQFASTVSHDLRNPLNVAQNRLTLVARERNSDHVEEIDDALTRMEAISEDVLTLARQGQPIDETEVVNLAELADQSWQLVDTGDADLTIEDDMTLTADADRLQQLLENLFRNSLDHGDTDVSVSVGTLPDESGFFVADDGPGIPAESRDSIFDSGYTTSDEGTGFGLSIVEEIVDAHGWTITLADSSGARFEITDIDTD